MSRSESLKAAQKKYANTSRGRDSRKRSRDKFYRTLKGRFNQSYSIATKRRKLEWSITFIEYNTIMTNASCYYCSGNLSETGSGLDRLDNSIGYTVKNVVPCCQECNRLKGAQYTPEETKAMVEALRDYRNKR